METLDEQVAILEVLYRQSKGKSEGNVTYPWEAIADLGPDKPLPAWIRVYLAEAAIAVAGMVHDRTISPKQAVDRIPAALGFVRPGRGGNAFAARRELERNADLAWKYELAKQPGNANQLKSAIADVLGHADMTSVERRIRRGRKMLKAQETAKKRRSFTPPQE
jgi:hypothetical protein